MIRDQKDLNSFVAKMAAGRTKAAAARASSTAPPSPAKPKSKSTAIPQETKAAGNASPASPIPKPAKSKGTNKKGGEPSSATRSIVINIR